MSSEVFGGLPTPRWRPWRELAVLGLMLMELSWLVPWYRSLTPATYAVSPVYAFLVLGMIYLLVHFVVRFMNFIYLRMDLRRVILVGVFILSFYIGVELLLYGGDSMPFLEMLNRPLKALSSWTVLIPDEFVIAVMVLVVGWRGISLAQARIGPILVKRNFQIGILMFVTFVMINTLATGETPGLLLYLFIFSGLISMGSARISVLRSLRGGEQSPFDRRWFLGMVFASVVVVGLAAGIASLASGEFSFYDRVVSVIFRVLLLILALLSAPLVYLFVMIINRMDAPGLSQVAGDLLENLESVRTSLMELAGRLAGKLGFLERLPNLKPLFFWSLIGVITLLIVSGMSRWWIKERKRLEAERQTILSRGEMMRLFGEAFKKQMAKLGQGLAGLARLRHGRRLLAAARIRRIYIELMELSEELEVARAEAETPLEFLPALRGLFPGSETELDTITQAYLKVRYGELPETEAEVNRVESAWKRVNMQGRELRSSQKKSSAV